MSRARQADLAADWMLGRGDVACALGARGARNRLFAATQLCALRVTGAFMDWSAVPLDVLHHLARQLGQAPVAVDRGVVPAHSAQRLRRRAREHLGFRGFDDEAEHFLEDELTACFTAEADVAALGQHAATVLLEICVVRPGDTTMDRLQGRVVRAVTERMCAAALHRVLPEHLDQLDELLRPAASGARSALGRLKQLRSGKPADAFREALVLHALLQPLVGLTTATRPLPDPWQRRLAQLAAQADAATLRRHRRPVRVAAVACYVALGFRELLDEVVELYDTLVSQVCARATASARKAVRDAHTEASAHLEVAGLALEALLEAADANTARDEIIQSIGKPRLRAATAALLKPPVSFSDAFVGQMKRRYGRLRLFLPGFFALPLQAERGSESLLRAIELVRHMDATSGRLPPDAPVDFLRAPFRGHLVTRGMVRAVWETGLAIETRDALRRGDLYLVGAHHHAALTSAMHDDTVWAEVGPVAVEALGLTADPLDVLAALDDTIETGATALAKGLSTNPIARIQAGALRVGRDKRRRVPDQVHKLRRALRTNLPNIRIEELLVEVNAITGFVEALVPVDTSVATPRAEARLAALLAHGTNLGVGAMARSLEGVELQELDRASRRCLSVPALSTANRRLVETIARYTQDPVGGTTRTASDAQRYPVSRRSRVAGYFPPRHGFHQRSLKLYGHQVRGAMLATQVIACTEAEALYVLDPLLDPESPVASDAHHTDTHGATLVLFGVSHLLGIELQPWLARPATRQLFAHKARRGPDAVAGLFVRDVDRSLITEQWDRMLRVVVALAERRAIASVLIRRISGSRLGIAFVELGRLVRTAYLLRWLHDEPMRRSIRRTLNLMESRHKLSRDLFFGGHGRFSGHSLRSITRRASALALLSNCVVTWNAVRLHRAVMELRAAGQRVDDDVLAGLSPLGSAHVQTRGVYRFKSLPDPLRETIA